MTKSIRNLSIISGVIILSLAIVFLTGQPSRFLRERVTPPNLNNRGDGDLIESGRANSLETKAETHLLTAFGRSLIDDTDAAMARTTLDVPGKSADETISGSWRWSKTLTTDTTQAIAFQEINFQLDFPIPNNVWHLGQRTLVQTLPTNVSNNQNLILSATAQAKHWGTDTLTGAVAFEGLAANQSTGTIANAVGVTGTIEQNAAGTITVGKLFEGILGEPFLGTTGTLYGLYLPNINVATTNYAIYSAGGQSYHAGNFGIGVTTPKTKLEVDGIIKTIPRGSAICNADSEGGIYYDSDDKHFYGCNGVSWIRLDN